MPIHHYYLTPYQRRTHKLQNFIMGSGGPNHGKKIVKEGQKKFLFPIYFTWMAFHLMMHMGD
jgi:hypothetical protein